MRKASTGNGRGEPYKSQTRRIPPDQRPEGAAARGGFPTNYPNYNPVERFAFTYPPQQTDWILNHLFGDRVQGQTFATEYFDIFNETDFRKVSGRRGEALQTMAAEFFAKGGHGRDRHRRGVGRLRRPLDGSRRRRADGGNRQDAALVGLLLNADPAHVITAPRSERGAVFSALTATSGYPQLHRLHERPSDSL